MEKWPDILQMYTKYFISTHKTVCFIIIFNSSNMHTLLYLLTICGQWFFCLSPFSVIRCPQGCYTLYLP